MLLPDLAGQVIMKPLSRRGIDLRPGAITSRLMCRLALFGRFSRFWFSEPS